MIRAATPLDVPAILEIGVEFFTTTPTYARLEFDRDRLAEVLFGLIDSPHGHVMVADEGGRVVGLMLAAASQHWCARNFIASEMALYVHPSIRGSMLAARLIKGYLAWGRALGCTVITAGVSTGKDVERTTALYVRLGFKQFGTQLEA